MKKLLGTEITGSYTFNKTAKTVTFTSLPVSITLANILLITNVTSNTIIYNFADSATGAVSFNNNVLTLTFDTSAMFNTDVLQIYLDVDGYEESLHTLLRRMNKLLESNAIVDLQQRQRVTVDVMPTTTVTGTVTVGTAPTTAVTNTTGIGASSTVSTPANLYTLTSLPIQNVMEGPVDQRWRIIDAAKTAYATGIRANLIW